METLEQPAVEESLLIFSNDTEINKIVEDARIRANFLNEIISAGVPVNRIKDLSSEKSIENYIFELHLQQNPAMAMEYSQGKRQRHLSEAYILPDPLENLQRLLLTWLTFPKSLRASDKYQFLKVTDGRFEVDIESLEREFIMRKLKFYIQGDDVTEYRQLEIIIKYFQDHRCPNNQAALISFLSDRFESIGQFKYKVRWRYFDRDRH